MTMTNDKKGGAVTNYSLQVSEDGRSATMSMTCESTIVSGVGPNPQAAIGEVKHGLVLTLDLSGEKPVVTNAKISQEFGI